MVWLFAGAPLVAAAVVVLALMLLTSTRKRDDALRWQEHSYSVMILAGKLDSTMARSEATLGRFVISGDESVGRAYAEDWRRAGTILNQLTRTVADDSNQANILRELRAAYDTRGKEMGETAIRTTYAQNDEALALYYRNGKSATLPRIDALLRKLITEERALLVRRTAVTDARVARTNWLTAAIAALGIIAAIGVVLLGFTLVQGILRRREEERRGDRLEEAVFERTAELREANAQLHAEMESREGAEAQLRQVQKMDAVGQLTGGIAHDFNNMLAVVINGLELAQRKLGGVHDAHRHIDSAMEGANRAAALTKRLLAFARSEPLLPVLTNADKQIEGMSEMLDRTLGDRIIVVIRPGSGGWRTLVDRHQLENAILNLAVNSRDAMPNGGTLSIATSQAKLTRDARPAGDGEFVRIDVSDTGCGIAPAVLERVFEPFFTTKPTGKGTGLGLSQLFSFVRQSGGTIDIDSIVGRGTTVSIFLPRNKGRVKPALNSPENAPLSGEPVSGASILVVEDDRRVLAATVAALAELGHRPLPCAEVDDAPRLLAQHPEIDLIFSDVMMPGATGPDLVKQLRRNRPNIPVIYATGFAGDIADAAAFGDDPVLRKPYTIGVLDATIARTLGGRTAEVV